MADAFNRVGRRPRRLPRAERLLRRAFPNPTFADEGVDFEDFSFRPGNEDCWQRRTPDASALTFDRCCNATRQVTSSHCWESVPGLSFDSCCGPYALRRSTRPRRNRVVVALTSTPYRLYAIRQVLLSLAHQTYEPDALYLSLPLVFARDWTWYNVPWWFQDSKLSQLRINRCDQDYRSQTGLNCVLQHEPAPGTYIMLVDDDIVFHPHLLDSLLAESAKAPDAMIGAVAYLYRGSYCRRTDDHGVCTLPNLVHTNYGKLFQRRFFDGGIFNFGAAAHALAIASQDRAPPLDYVLTSCMISNDLWTEAHLAKKGIPRVFMRNYFGAAQIYQLAFHHGALNSNYQGTHHHDASDPHTIDEAEQVCYRALAALWGTALWAKRSRRVAAAMLSRPAPLSSDAAEIAAVVGSLAWLAYDVAVVFVCSGRALGDWRLLLEAHGGLYAHLFYLYRYVQSGESPAYFDSELFDAAAFVPERLALKQEPSSGMGFRPSASVPGYETAGVARLQVDVVELCAAHGAPPSSPPPATNAGTCAEVAFVARICGDFAVEQRQPSSYAGVRCCTNSVCMPAWRSRNISWFGMCLPQIATYYDAARICQALNSDLCDAEGVKDCCGVGCEARGTDTWLRAPAGSGCDPAPITPPTSPLERQRRARQRSHRLPSADWTATAPTVKVLKERANIFFDMFEAAHGTVIKWVEG